MVKGDVQHQDGRDERLSFEMVLVFLCTWSVDDVDPFGDAADMGKERRWAHMHVSHALVGYHQRSE